MPFDPTLLKVEHQDLWKKQCVAFCSVLRHNHLTKNDPPAARSKSAAVAASRNGIKVLYLPVESTKMICEYAFGFSQSDMLDYCVMSQCRHYSRLPGKIVLSTRARIGERVRRSDCFDSEKANRGMIIGLACDRGTEVAVRWDDGMVTADSRAGFKCGKKDKFDLVYEDMLDDYCIKSQRRNYSRLAGKIVLQEKAQIGERVRRSDCLDSGKANRGTIISLDCDRATEVAVRWDDGSVTGNSYGGLKCGKKSTYSLVYL